MMESNPENNNKYWQYLIRDEEVGPDLWNRFLSYHYPSIVKVLIVDEEPNKLWSDKSQMSEVEIKEIKKIRERHGKPPIISDTRLIQPFMNFSFMEFDSEISFARRILIGADFRNTVFKGGADFSETVFLGNTYFNEAKLEFDSEISFARRNLIGADFRNTVFGGAADFSETVFLGRTHFNEAKFLSFKPIQSIAGNSVVSFDKSSFQMEANFDSVQFPYRTTFNETRFSGFVYFREATFGERLDKSGFVSIDKAIFNYLADFAEAVFNVNVSFRNTHFDFRTVFSKVQFNYYADFKDTEFSDQTEFFKARFNNRSNFNNCRFLNTISFNEASFSQPPKFFNTEIHEDIHLFDINWSITEKFYSRNNRNIADIAEIKIRADNANNAWNQLALIMSRQEKAAERHVFFCLKMRAQRQRDGKTFLTCLNCLYEELSDYGWGVGHAFLWWGLHIYLGAVFLGFVACYQISSGFLGFVTCYQVSGGCGVLLKMFGNSLLASFANSISFLGLGSKGGHLYGPSMAASDAIAMQWVFPTVGTVQAVIGPILLFLVLLTIRNRFKIK